MGGIVVALLIATNVMSQSGSTPGGGVELVQDQTPEKGWVAAERQILTNVQQLTSPEMGLDRSGEAYFSPDLGRIIFQAYPKGQSEYEMFTLSLTGKSLADRDSLRQVSPGGGACTCGYFRPDGRGIIFASSYHQPDLPNPNRYQRHEGGYAWKMPGGMDVFAAESDGSGLRQLTKSAGYDAECAYSPDGKSIVFASDRDGNPDLYIMRSDGSEVRRLTHSPGYDGGPFFSPDGKRVIFRADRKQDDHLQLFVIDADGRGECQLTAHCDVVNWAPFWLPGGRSVVFTTSLHGHYNYEVYLLNIESGRHRRVTFSPRFDGLPVVSPDGRKMMWTSQRGPGGSSQVFIADFKRPEGF